MSQSAQRTLRLVVQAVLEAVTGVPVQSPGDWETPTINLPEIKLRSPGNRKASIARAGANFTTTVSLELQARVSADTAEGAQDAIEALAEKIEAAVLSLPDLIALVQQVASVDTEMSVSADSRTHIGEIRMMLQCETFEEFDPRDSFGDRFIDLQHVAINVDTAYPFDPTGTYAGAAFPAAVQPAPRTSGPDGRNEGVLQIPLT